MDVKFHLEIVGFQPTFYDIGNTCTEDNAGNDVTVDVEVIRKIFTTKLSHTFYFTREAIPQSLYQTKLLAR